MYKANLIGICCNWGAYAAYVAAGMTKLEMPPNFKMIRLMCIGRINQAMVLRAFEYGADGAILLKCNPGDCRYGPGPDIGHNNVEKIRKLLDLLGIGQQRLKEESFSADEKVRLVKTLWDFAENIESIGPNPAKPLQERNAS